MAISAASRWRQADYLHRLFAVTENGNDRRAATNKLVTNGFFQYEVGPEGPLSGSAMEPVDVDLGHVLRAA